MKKKRQYTKAFKESVLRRLEHPSNESVATLAKELTISKSTIYQWVRTNNKTRDNSSIILKNKNNWTSEDKFHVVIETASLTESELSEYCRKKGIYLEEINAWREQCRSANLMNFEDPKELKDNLKLEQEKNKALLKELRRKEKALAETAALLVLKKKAQLIWGEEEEE